MDLMSGRSSKVSATPVVACRLLAARWMHTRVLLGVLVLACCRSAPSDPEPQLARLLARYGTELQRDDLDPELWRIRAALRDGRLRLDEAVLERCLAAGSSTGVFFERGRPDEACLGLWSGQTASGERCDLDLECRDGFCDRVDFSHTAPHFVTGGCGVCRARSREGGPCNDHGWVGGEAECAPGLSCVAGVCTRPARGGERGEGCPCREGLACVRGLCADPQASGGACGADADCASGVCLRQGRCGPATEGAPCANALDCGGALGCFSSRCAPTTESLTCRDPLACGAGLTCAFGACRGPAAIGARCAVDAQCPAGAGCVGFTCRRQAGPGERCDLPDTTCAGGLACAEGRCARRPLRDEACDGVCAEGRCLEGRCVAREVGSECQPLTVACGAELACGESSSCLLCCALAAPRGARCGPSSLASMTCSPGDFCSREDRCEPVCVLGDGRSRVAARSPLAAVDAGWPDDLLCPLTAGPSSVRLTAEQARCLGADREGCASCHRPVGCGWELRPDMPDAIHELDGGLLAACGIDAGP